MNEASPVKISFNDMILKACGVALKKNPNDDKDGMSKKNLIGIKIYGYPNPTHEKVTLYFQSDIDNEGEVAVYNLMGEKVINEFKVKNQEHFAIDLGNNIMGIYIVKFLINGNLYEYKIVKID